MVHLLILVCFQNRCPVKSTRDSEAQHCHPEKETACSAGLNPRNTSVEGDSRVFLARARTSMRDQRLSPMPHNSPTGQHQHPTRVSLDVCTNIRETHARPTRFHLVCRNVGETSWWDFCLEPSHSEC